MIRLAVCLLIALLSSGSIQTFAASGSYTLDPAHTYLHFSVSHLGFSTLYGRFDKTSGKFTLDLKAKTAAAEVKIDAASISTGMQKRDEHLLSPDFFNAVEYPVITFKSTVVKFNGDAPVSIEGDLTLLGVTRSVSLSVTAFKCGINPMNQKKLCGLDATGKIKRSDFGMRYALPNVGDDIKLIINAEGYLAQEDFE